MTDFASKLRAREQLIGYWVVLDAPAATERIARAGYDYVTLDGQHGQLAFRGLLDGLTAIDAGGALGNGTVGLVRVEANHPTPICRALDAGAVGVIVPLVNTPEEAALAVQAARYPPAGIRSYGPGRAVLRVGPAPADANETIAVIAMIETAAGLENVAGICATPGLDGIYVGPSDLGLAVGARFPGDPEASEVFEEALVTIAAAAEKAGVAAGIHCRDGASVRQRLTEGYTFASVASDLNHIEAIAADHLAAARNPVE